MVGIGWTDSTMEAAGTRLHVARAGRGRPVMVLHHETGTLDRLPFYDALAEHYDVLVPHHPGYGRSQRPDWMRCTRDIAVIYRGLFEPGILALWGNDGRASQEDSLTCVRLMGTEVFPALREIAKELDLESPFESNAPVHLRYSKDLEPTAKAAAE